jgi:hypothetical protein
VWFGLVIIAVFLTERWAKRAGPLKTFDNWPRGWRAVYRIATLILVWLAFVALIGHFTTASIIFAAFAILIWITLAFSSIGELRR